MKIRGGPHLTSCQESRLNDATGKREEILFFTEHCPFPSYLKRFNLASIANCPCGNTNGTPLHYVTECILTASFHMTKPAQQHELIWFRNVACNKGSRLKI
ncbi:hypothetical protein AVEN_76753-1 [Araneus ventricosus]|uniref:Uncharacterized protein n=1 Tax=Araneus ventricosus TaxID=182803 RepID=A0A4Y2W6Y2_ARAVE|nr:hypothetical protein AVEN_76753-1 [Araneus ventricosus]